MDQRKKEKRIHDILYWSLPVLAIFCVIVAWVSFSSVHPASGTCMGIPETSITCTAVCMDIWYFLWNPYRMEQNCKSTFWKYI